MKTITIITPANIELEYRLAGAGSRLAAFLIDFAIQLLVMGLIITSILVLHNRVTYTLTAPDGAALAAILVVIFVVHFGYFTLLEMVMNGQSVGKRIFGLRAIRENGQPLVFSNILMRSLFRASIDMIYVGLFVILFSKQHKRLGDMAAGTIVVSEHYLAKDEPGLFAPTTTLPDFLLPHEQAMTKKERGIVDEWLRRKDTLPDYGADIERRLQGYFTHKAMKFYPHVLQPKAE
ncbi:MAG: RDD family protein [Defluviitaleaceae bacterium]|nr:RDD family protein [Defluviitaleaceae bacterium]